MIRIKIIAPDDTFIYYAKIADIETLKRSLHESHYNKFSFSFYDEKGKMIFVPYVKLSNSIIECETKTQKP